MKRLRLLACSEQSEGIFYAPCNDNLRARRLMAEQRNQRGFTLVELLVSFALVFILITGTAQLTIHSLLLKRRADCNLRTAELAFSKLEHLKSLPYESEELKEGFQIESVKEEGLLETFWREWRIQDISSDMKRIEIEVFSENFTQKKLRMVLFLSKNLGF
jgi:prepilin-type N-terminal cleavage/methylation domain-containing protein